MQEVFWSPVTLDKLSATLREMAVNKMLGPDDIAMEFYKAL
jgi:hypothetical protein